jgi:hypothetical protein
MALSIIGCALSMNKVHKKMENNPLEAQNMSLNPFNLL